MPEIFSNNWIWTLSEIASMALGCMLDKTATWVGKTCPTRGLVEPVQPKVWVGVAKDRTSEGRIWVSKISTHKY